MKLVSVFCTVICLCLGSYSSGTCSDSEGPSITLSGDRTQKLYSKDSLRIVADASSSCKDTDYSWSLYSDGGSVTVDSTSDDPSIFSLEPYSLSPASNYTLQVEISDSNGDSSAEVQLVVLTSSLNVMIDGGYERAISYYDKVELEATVSDPDNEDGDVDGTSYYWSCFEVDTMNECNITVSQDMLTSSFFSLDQKALPSGITYKFQLNASGESVDTGLEKTGSNSVVIYVDSEYVPSVSISDTEGVLLEKISAMSKFRLKGRVRANWGDLYGTSVWSAAWVGDDAGEDPVDLDALASVALVADAEPGTAITHSLVIPSMNLYSKKYDRMCFTLSAYYDGETAIGYSEVEVDVNTPPLNGTLIVEPQTGMVLVTLSNFTTSDWIDDAGDFPLTFKFIYYIEDEIQALGLTSEEPTLIAAMLPKGDEDNGYILSCGVKAADKYGASSIEVIEVVSEPFVSTSLEDVSTQLDSLLREEATSENAAQQLQVVSAVSSTIEEECTSSSSSCDGIITSLLDTTSEVLAVLDVSLESMNQVATSVETLATAAAATPAQKTQMLEVVAAWAGLATDIGVLDESADSITDSLGQVLGTGTEGEDTSLLLGAVKDLAAAMGVALEAGEEAKTSESDNLKVLSQKVSANSMGDEATTIELGSSENTSTALKFGNSDETNIAGGDMANILGADFAENPFGEINNFSARTGFSGFVGLSVSSSASDGEERRLTTGGYIKFSLIFSHPNLFSGGFLSNTTLPACLNNSFALEEVQCGPSPWQSFEFQCNGSDLFVNCDQARSVGTSCQVVDKDGNVAEGSCTRKMFNDTHTVCECLQEDDADIVEVFFVQMENIGNEVLDNFAAAEELFNLKILDQTLSENWLVLVALGTVCITVPLLTYCSEIFKVLFKHGKCHFELKRKIKRYLQIRKERNKVKQNPEDHDDLVKAYQKVIPTILQKGKKAKGLMTLFAEEHLGLRMLGEAELPWTRPRKAAHTLATFLTMMFWDATVFGAIFPADGTCARHTTEEFCEAELNQYDLSQSVCTWTHPDDPEYAPYCTESEPESTPFLIIYITVMTMILSVPFDFFISLVFEKLIFPEPRAKRRVSLTSHRAEIGAHTTALDAFQSYVFTNPSVKQLGRGTVKKTELGDSDAASYGGNVVDQGLATEENGSQHEKSSQGFSEEAVTIVISDNGFGSSGASISDEFVPVPSKRDSIKQRPKYVASSGAEPKATPSSLLGDKEVPTLGTVRRVSTRHRPPMKSLGPGPAIGGDASESSFKQEQERERLEDQQVMRITGGQGDAQAPSLRQRSIRDINGIRIQMTKSQQGSSRLFELSKNVSSRLVFTRQSSEELRRKQNKIRKMEMRIQGEVEKTYDLFIQQEGHQAIKGTFSCFNVLYYASEARQVAEIKRRIRAHHLRAGELLAELEAAPDGTAREALLMRAARRDYQTIAERRVLGLVEGAEGGGGEVVWVSSRLRRKIGWAVIFLYCVFCSFYVLLFGINHGPAVARLWLETFLLGLGEDLVVLLPLKLWVVFYLLPSFMSHRIEIKRMQDLPSYSSCRLAALAYPELATSKAILGSTAEHNSTPASVFKHGSRPLTVLISKLLLVFVVMPFLLQEVLLECALVSTTNFIIIGIFIGHTQKPGILYPVLGMCLFIFIAQRLRTHCQQKRQHEKEKARRKSIVDSEVGDNDKYQKAEGAIGYLGQEEKGVSW